MPTDKTILNEIDNAMAYCEGFIERLKGFRKTITTEEPKRKNRKQEIRDQIRRSLESSMTRKTFR